MLVPRRLKKGQEADIVEVGASSVRKCVADVYHPAYLQRINLFVLLTNEGVYRHMRESREQARIGS